MPHSTSTKKQLAITTSPAIASLWKLIAILIEFSHWQILTSFRNTSNERRTHLDHRSCTLCSLVLQGVLFSLQGWLKTKSQPMKALQNTVIEIIALMWSLPSGKLWQFAIESLNWAWRCHFTSLPLMAAVLRYMFLLGAERSMSVGLLRLHQQGITEAMGHLCDSGSCVYECVGCMAAVPESLEKEAESAGIDVYLVGPSDTSPAHSEPLWRWRYSFLLWCCDSDVIVTTKVETVDIWEIVTSNPVWSSSVWTKSNASLPWRNY